jgi:hypothetical protein
LVEYGEVSLVFQVAPEQTLSIWLGASTPFGPLWRTISTSFCEGLHGAFRAGLRLKVMPFDPLFEVDAVTVPDP